MEDPGNEVAQSHGAKCEWLKIRRTKQRKKEIFGTVQGTKFSSLFTSNLAWVARSMVSATQR